MFHPEGDSMGNYELGKLYDLKRSGSVRLNTFARFLSGISALLTLPLSLATFVRRKPRQAFSCPTVNAAAFGEPLRNTFRR